MQSIASNLEDFDQGRLITLYSNLLRKWAILIAFVAAEPGVNEDLYDGHFDQVLTMLSVCQRVKYIGVTIGDQWECYRPP